MASSDLINIFEDCAQLIASGQSLEDCLNQYPAQAAHLRPLLEASDQIKALRITQAELAVDQAQVWQKIDANLPPRGNHPWRFSPFISILLFVVAALSLLWLAQRPSMSDDAKGSNPLVAASSTSTVTLTSTLTATATPTNSPTSTLTASATPTNSPTPTLTPTATVTSSPTPTKTPTTTYTPGATIRPSLTFAPGCNAPLTEEGAVHHVLEIYPNTTITHVAQTVKFDNTLVWEVRTSHGLEINIDVACGYVLTIERIVRNGDNISATPNPQNDGAGNNNGNDNSSSDNGHHGNHENDGKD